MPPRHDVIEEAARLERPAAAARLVILLGGQRRLLAVALGAREHRDGERRNDDAGTRHVRILQKLIQRRS